MTKRAALILAGGKARRFQTKQEGWQDKALAELSGKPLLVHVVENARSVVDEVVVCVNDETRKTKYSEALEKHGLRARFVVDEKNRHISGPTVAIMTGLKAAQADYCVTLPCDMPLIKPEVVGYLFEAAGDAEVTVPMWPNGRLETLLMVLERRRAAEITETLCLLRRPRSDDIIRGAEKVRFVSPVGEMRALEPELKSFVNINRPEDLFKLQTRPARGNITENFAVTLGALLVPKLQRMREAETLCHEQNFPEAAAVFSACATELENQKSLFWGGVSREKEAEALLVWSQLQKESSAAGEFDFKGRDAFLAAANNYRLEADMHFVNRCRFLAERAWSDRVWCEGWVMGKTGHGDRYPPKH